MGLDQYLIRISSPKKEQLSKFRTFIKEEDIPSFNNDGVCFYTGEEIDENFEKCLHKYFCPVKVENSYLNFGKLFNKKTKKELDDYLSTGSCYDGEKSTVYFEHITTGENLEFSYTREETLPFIYKQTDDMYAAATNNELGYFRKNYVLQNYMCDVLGYDGNCFHKKLSEKDVKMLIDDFSKLSANPNDASVLSKFDPECMGEDLQEDAHQLVALFSSLLDETMSKNSALCYYEWY